MLKIRELRIKKGIMQKEAANDLNIPPNTYNQYETGKREPDYETLKNIADYFGVSVDFILGRDEEENKKSSSDDEVWELREMLHKRPEMKTLFSLSKKASKEDVEQTIRIIEALKPKEYDD